MNIIELENKIIYRGSNYKTTEKVFLSLVAKGKPVALITTQKRKVTK
jgi:hypothetical protein